MRALVTGGHGFVGRHLAQHLVQCGDDVAITYYSVPGADGVKSEPETDVENKVGLPKTVQMLSLDVCDAKAVREVVSLLRPDVIYHLAAISFVPDGEKDPERVFEVNTRGTTNFLNAIRECSPETRLLYVSSSAVYGEPRPGALPVTEASELRPNTEYALSKVTADLQVYKSGYRDGLHVIRIRPFQHIGPGQSDRFAISSFAKQIANIKLGKSEPIIKVGNLEVKRDYSDVSDIVRGYREAILNGKSGEVYNLCSGGSVSIQELLNMLIERAGIEVEVVQDPSRVREGEVPEVYGSYDKAQRDFGWKPRVEREAMIDSILAYWLETLSD